MRQFNADIVPIKTEQIYDDDSNESLKPVPINEVSGNMSNDDDDDSSSFLEFIECNELPIELFDDTSDDSSDVIIEPNEKNELIIKSKSNKASNSDINIEIKNKRIKHNDESCNEIDVQENIISSELIEPIEIDNEFDCPYCKCIFTDKKIAEYHIKLRHYYQKEMPKVKQCSVCPQKYNNFGPYIKHFNKHFPDSFFECNYCNKHFMTDSFLMQHDKIHKSDNKFQCDRCDYSCETSRELKVSPFIIKNLEFNFILFF